MTRSSMPEQRAPHPDMDVTTEPTARTLAPGKSRAPHRVLISAADGIGKTSDLNCLPHVIFPEED